MQKKTFNKVIIGKKVGITRIFDDNGNAIPATVVEAGPCVVSDKKSIEKHGYSSIQLGFGEPNTKRMRKPQARAFKKLGINPLKYLKEFRVTDVDSFNVGDTINVGIFKAGDAVDVSGTSKGKGWAGVIKRWNFHRLRESHGSGPVVRHGGSIGQCSDPSRVYKGLRSAGHLGHEKVTVQNLTVIKVLEDKNLIAIKGSIPGPKGSIVYIKDSVKISPREGK